MTGEPWFNGSHLLSGRQTTGVRSTLTSGGRGSTGSTSPCRVVERSRGISDGLWVRGSCREFWVEVGVQEVYIQENYRR